MNTIAVVLERPEHLVLSSLALPAPEAHDVVVDIEWSGISTGTERLLWSGKMPPFPGLGYPLVPGYESVGRIADAGSAAGGRIGERVFVPGAKCFGEVRGLFGGAASRLVVPSDKAISIDETLGEQAVLMALAATAYHALAGKDLPDLIIGHGVLGRLLARIAVALGGSPIVWETNEQRRVGAHGYQVVSPESDETRGYRAIYDVSGDAGLINTLIGRLGHGGEIVLAGFYSEPISFAFPPAFMREARFRVAAEWKPEDLTAVAALTREKRLSLDGLITHRFDAADAKDAYRLAFTDATCLKMVLDWRELS